MHYPDKRLRLKAEAVTDFGAPLQALVHDMAETMYRAPGVGLAATQIGVTQSVFIVDLSSGEEDDPSDLRVFVNPSIVRAEGELAWEEGCLSFPGVREEIQRAEHVTVRAQDTSGAWFELTAEGLMSIAIQHEYDHLQGKLMIDHLSMLRRRMVHRAMMKRAAHSPATAG